MMISRRSFKTIVLVLALASIGAVIGIYTERYYRTSPASASMDGVFWPNSKQIGPFEMVNHRQDSFGPLQLNGKWTFMFFGYTSCPDLCPTTMAVLNEVSRQVTQADESEAIRVIFVTVDPERDTTDKLAAYIGHFNDQFIGLGGTIEQLNSLASQIGITYYYGPDEDDGSYLVNHTGSIFLLDPKAQLVSIFSAPFNPTDIYSRFLEIKEFITSQE